jgi:hypothetical protein
MAEMHRDQCRRAAAACVELARAMPDAEREAVLLMRAQEWLKLAYSQYNDLFEEELTEFNEQQMASRPHAEPMQDRPATVSIPLQQQPMQQQQSKTRASKDRAEDCVHAHHRQ